MVGTVVNPNLLSKILSLEIEICSPELSKTSSSLSFGTEANSYASFNNLSVVLPLRRNNNNDVIVLII